MSDLTGVQQAWLSEVAGLSSVTLGSMERPDHVASLLTYIQAARAVDLPLAELLDGAP